MYRTPTSSTAGASASASNKTPSPRSPSAPATDAGHTFIQRPGRKRRSIGMMDMFQRQKDIYARMETDNMLMAVMAIFEEIPTKVLEYPQMRKDIKSYLEDKSDKGLKMLFEVSRRCKEAEAELDALRAQPPLKKTPASAGPAHTIEGLEKLETAIITRLNDLEETLTQNVDRQTVQQLEGNTNVTGMITEKFEQAMTAIDHATKGIRVIAQTQITLDDGIRGIASDVAIIKDGVRDAANGQTCEPQPLPTYASVAAARPGHRPALHSMAVTLEGGLETADEVLARVKKAVDARGTGLKISKVRKAKNQTVILGCDTEAELVKVRAQIESRGEGLTAVPMTNKNPLVVLKDVFLDSNDDEMLKALYAQNGELFQDLPQDDIEMAVKYKKRTRNPKTAHVVIQVRPRVWQRMTEAGVLYLDLQRVRVEDQSPLIQCTRCLAFGHGRKFCAESVDKCSHCGGPHLRENCADFNTGNPPRCCNCSHSKLQRTDHNAFSAECPVRRKWDYLARTTTAYT